MDGAEAELAVLSACGLTGAALTLTAGAVAVLQTGDAEAKAQLSRAVATLWRSGRICRIGESPPPARPARPARPELRPPRDMPKRRSAGSLAGRIALLHALAHIELNAIDLAWDLIARFAHDQTAGDPLPRAFFDAWVQVADDEARHYTMLARRLEALGAAYGDLPAHDGLWQAALETAHDLAARLAVVPLVLEARGLDVTPAMIAGLRRAGDHASADAVQIIHDDEITHVAAGKRWFDHLCAARGVDPVATWQDLVRRHFKGELKPPFNEASRARAGFSAAFYAPLARP